MCLAVPMRVVHIEENVARVNVGGAEKTVRLEIIDELPKVGDYVLVHAGFAIHLIDEEEARITLGYLKELFAHDTEIYK